MPAQPTVHPLPRGRHRLTREQVVASQRGRMLEAMASAVAESGYARTSVADVTARAGVSSKTFYEQFDSKEECFLAAYDVCVDALIATIEDSLGSTKRSPLTRFDRAIGAYLDALASEPALARTFLIEVYAAGPRALERRREVQRRFAGLLAGILAPPRSGRAPARHRFAFEALVGAISALVTTRVGAGELDRLPALRRPIVELVERQLEAGNATMRAAG